MSALELDGVALAERVRARLAASGQAGDDASINQALRAEGVLLGDADLRALARRVRSALVGLGELEPLLADERVTDILVNGAGRVWVDRGDGLREVAVHLGGEDGVRRLAQRLAAGAGRRLDDAHPFMEAALETSGQRVRAHAVLPPVALGGTHLSLRIPRPGRFGLAELTAQGTVPERADPILRAVVRSRLAFLVTGGTGAGKTTLLQALLELVPPTERLVVIEDTAELAPAHPHVVHLAGRPANLEGAGEIALASLVRQALRMRPDRVVVGEARGPEVVDLLAALNTGHDGGAATLHANAPAEVPARVEALAAMAGVARPAAHSLLAAAVRVVLHVRRDGGRRRLSEVAVVRPRPDGLAEVVPAWVADGDGLPPAGAGQLRRWLERG